MNKPTLEQKPWTRNLWKKSLFFLTGCIVGVLLMIFLPNPMRSQVGNTEQNLRRGAIGEGYQTSRYLLLAQQAKEEDQPALSALFRAAAQGEQHRAQMLLKTEEQAVSLEEGLRMAIRKETEDSETLYPAFWDVAEQEGNLDAMQVFQMAAEGQKMQAELLAQGLEGLQGGTIASVYHLCSNCGALYGENPPDTCTVCHADSELFSDFE